MQDIGVLQIALLALYLGWIYVNIMIADAKNLTGWGPVLISFLLTPLIGSIYVIGMPANAED